MPKLPFIKTLAVLFAALFLLGQGMAQAHAIEFGTSHDHDGVACTVSILGEDEAVAPAPLETETLPVTEAPAVAITPTRIIAFSSAHTARAPPTRAPPH